MNRTVQHLEPPPSTSASQISTPLLIIISLLIIILSHQTLASFPQYDIFIYATCSQAKSQPDSLFQTNLKSFLYSLYTSSSHSPSNTSTDSGGPLYGLYQCRGDLTLVDCSRCIGSAVDQLGLECPNNLEASLQLEGCFLTYGQVDYTGKPDTGVRFKKCSTHLVEGDDVNFVHRRDDVLEELKEGVGATGFKVSTSGLVEGYAQCLSDLVSSGDDCASCVTEAAGKLKQLCGSAAAAEVYLGKCYARYWTSGYYDFTPPESNNNDGMGKTVTIIVGVVAGLAILVVVLSMICRKSIGVRRT